MSSEEMLGTEILHEPEPSGGSTSVPHSTPIVAEPVECMPWGASGAPRAAHERCGCRLVGAQLVGAHAAANKKLIFSWMATRII